MHGLRGAGNLPSVGRTSSRLPWWIRAVVVPIVGEALDARLLVKLCLWNAAGLVAVGRLLGVSGDAVKDFAPCWPLLVVTAAVAESDGFRRLRRRGPTGTGGFYLTMVLAGSVAVGVGLYERGGRAHAAAADADRRRDADELQARLRSPDARRAMALVDQVNRARWANAQRVPPRRAAAARPASRGS